MWEAKVFAAADAPAETNWKHKVTPHWGALIIVQWVEKSLPTTLDAAATSLPGEMKIRWVITRANFKFIGLCRQEGFMQITWICISYNTSPKYLAEPRVEDPSSARKLLRLFRHTLRVKIDAPSNIIKIKSHPGTPVSFKEKKVF